MRCSSRDERAKAYVAIVSETVAIRAMSPKNSVTLVRRRIETAGHAASVSGSSELPGAEKTPTEGALHAAAGEAPGGGRYPTGAA